MRKLLRADFYRMYHNRKIWLCAAGMLTAVLMFVLMQYTAMDYEVPFSRVLFLPITFYGVAVAAFISLFVGEDFSDGVIRNKVTAGRTRSSIYLSNLFCGWLACLGLYVLTVTATAVIGMPLFERDVAWTDFWAFLTLGAFTCLAFGSLFGMLSLLIGERSASVLVCMGLAFFLLFLCMHTNQNLVQEPYKDGLVNPHYVAGAKRAIYELLHDGNPFGQVAQLSSMKYLNLGRWILCDLFWIFLAVFPGMALFCRRDIK